MHRIAPIALVLVMLSCSPSREEIAADFDAFVAMSNACQADGDCVFTTAECPLGCTRAVRADRVAQVQAKARELIEEYERSGQSCEYECAAPAGPPSCLEGRCQAPMPDTQGGQQSEPRGCTTIGCGYPFSVHFDKPAPWAAGSYRVRVVLDARVIECVAEVPLSCDAAAACSDAAVSLQRSGCALPPDAHAITGFDVLQGSPTAVAVEVFDARGLLASGQWQPRYSQSSPNGPECGPPCTSAPRETLTF